MPSVPPSLAWAHPLIQDWFVQKFGTPTEPQEQGWPQTLAGRTTLISAPTGSGKTLAAFLACIDGFVRKALHGEMADRTEVLYVSPLKALGNDIRTNLEIPLGEIRALAGNRGVLMPEIRTAVRTGDTPMHERRAMLARPPHILVTTPESLYILLTAEKSCEILRDVKTVIVDEIHAVADDKRGAHLALSLERLEFLTGSRPVRIGLSATQKPIEVVARFLSGADRPDPQIVQIGLRREMDLAIEVPRSELGPITTNEMWDEIYNRIAQLATQHRSTLVFVNTRRLAERVALHLGERLGKEAVATHHGSLSRRLRLAAEKKLKAGEVRALVATASLELGVDIGSIDLVCQIGSPRSISVALQRIGRAGHWRGAVPKGRVFATTRDELLESAAGDIILLGNSSWRIRRVESGRILVEDAQGAPPNVPFWRGEAPGRTSELSAHLAELRERISSLTSAAMPGDTPQQSAEVSAAAKWLKSECGLDDAGAEQAVEDVVAGRAVLSAVPTQTTVIAERSFDESGGMQLIIHAPFGARINKAWGLALRKRFCRSFNFELQAAATDNGLNISLT